MRNFLTCLCLCLCLTVPAFAAASLNVTSDHEAKVYLGSTYLGKTPLEVSSVKVGSHTLKVESLETGEVKTYPLLSPRSGRVEKSIEVAFGGSSRRSLSRVEADGRDSEGRRVYDSASGRDVVERPVYENRSHLSSGDCRCACCSGLYDASRVSGYYNAPVYAAPVYAAPVYTARPVYSAPAYSYATPYYGDAYATPYHGASYAAPYYGNSYDPYRRQSNPANNFRNVLLGAGLVNEVFNNGGSRSDIRRGVVGAAVLNELVRGSRGSNYGSSFGGGGSSGLGGLLGF
jgi:hypothetical protein